MKANGTRWTIRLLSAEEHRPASASIQESGLGLGWRATGCLWGALGGGVGGTREARGGTGKERAGETDSGKAGVTRRALAPRSRLWPSVTEGGPYREGPRTRVFPRQSGASAAALRT